LNRIELTTFVQATNQHYVALFEKVGLVSGQIRTTILVYLVGVSLLTMYGGAVCPLIARIPWYNLAASLTVIFGCVLVARFKALAHLRKNDKAGDSRLNHPQHILWVDLTAWLIGGLMATTWHFAVYGYEVASGLKLSFGCLTFSLFSSAYLSLDCEARVIRSIKFREKYTPSENRFFSITSVFLAFLGIAMTLIVLVMLLLLYKDHYFDQFEFVHIVQEVVFVFTVLLSGCFIVGRKYSSNLRQIFNLQLEVFERVQSGEYDRRMPVVSHDEFSLIARHANQMIAGLQDRERIRSVLGKYLSRPLAESILKDEADTELGGRDIKVAVLFTDIRGYTSLSEELTPQELVRLLNDYFELVVTAVHNHGGSIDKFMGDSAMAVFGLDGSEEARNAAVQAAFEIRAYRIPFNKELEAQGIPKVDFGVGIAFGRVIAGNIGSPNRLEYTVIGDAVNVAARLEKMTKQIGSPIAITQSVYNGLNEDNQRVFGPHGELEIHGKSQVVPVYRLVEPSAVGTKSRILRVPSTEFESVE